MKKKIDNIAFPINKDLKKFDSFLMENLHSEVNVINSITKYLIKSKGKQFRTVLCLLSSRLTGEKVNKFSFLSAATVEILHVATLLHDDVVDDSDVRRGWPTVNKIWKNKLSILIGDYLFSKSLSNISKFNDLNCVSILSSVSQRLSEGEILQIEKAINKNMNEQEYFKMIADKTASLISASCYLGLYSTNKDEHLCEAMKKFGEYLGIAYQIKDDLFDIVGNINNTGKQSNLDLKKNMLTLPYIHALSSLNKIERKIFLTKIKKYASKSDINNIKKMIVEYGGIAYTENKIFEISEKAKSMLNQFPESKYKDALNLAVDFNISRSY
ncbi:MAG: polyprenyl synthetase [Candidatus Marinimicrobia bacterium]|nr:polyprenyl synthetase [Candidatus Neomarinimicrobiota bacterium]|tara:strand:- start:31169 stop:32149 length:981 start_codon:yes stop_codon:yes gene_type:complete